MYTIYSFSICHSPAFSSHGRRSETSEDLTAESQKPHPTLWAGPFLCSQRQDGYLLLVRHTPICFGFVCCKIVTPWLLYFCATEYESIFTLCRWLDWCMMPGAVRAVVHHEIVLVISMTVAMWIHRLTKIPLTILVTEHMHLCLYWIWWFD